MSLQLWDYLQEKKISVFPVSYKTVTLNMAYTTNIGKMILFQLYQSWIWFLLAFSRKAHTGGNRVH